MRTLVLFAAIASPSLAHALDVAVISGDEKSSSDALAAQLTDSTEYSFDVTTLDATSVTSAAQLAGFDVVIFGDSGHNNAPLYTSTFTDAVASFQDGGGGVITGSWLVYLNASSVVPIVPIDTTLTKGLYCQGPTTITLSGDHQVTADLSVIVDTSNYTETPSPALPDALVLGTASCNSLPVVIVAEPGSGGRQVYLGLLFAGNVDSYKNTGLRTDDADQLIEQAVAWAGGCSDLDGDGVSDCRGDCDDDDPDRFPGNPEVCDGLDNDCDDAVPSDEADQDEDGYRICDEDCDDTSDLRFPGNPEVCDQIDNNCDDTVDDGLATIDVYPDSDGDGYGASDLMRADCMAFEGYVTEGGDCDDDDPDVSPGAEEINGNDVDEDCDGSVGVDDAEDVVDVDAGCGCDTTQPSAALWVGLLLLGLARRRRR